MVPQGGTLRALKAQAILGGLEGCSPRKFLKKITRKRCFQRFWKPSISFPGKAEDHSNSL